MSERLRKSTLLSKKILEMVEAYAHQEIGHDGKARPANEVMAEILAGTLMAGLSLAVETNVGPEKILEMYLALELERIEAMSVVTQQAPNPDLTPEVLAKLKSQHDKDPRFN